MRIRALDSMASDSYLLKPPAACPVHPCQCRHPKPRLSPPCSVVVTLVFLLGAILALAALAYCQRMELEAIRIRIEKLHREYLEGSQKLEYMHFQFDEASRKIDRLHSFEQIKVFEAAPGTAKIFGDDDDDEDEDFEEDDYDDDPADPVYPDTEETNVVEGKARAQDDDVTVPRLEPAGGHDQYLDVTTTTTTTPIPDADPTETLVADVGRRRREVGRPQPQLRLYHMLQESSGVPAVPAAAPLPEPWSLHGVSRPQLMYAEHAPMAYASPPQRYVAGGTTAAPVASRRSRVMDAAATPAAGPHRRRHQQQRLHQHHQGRRQGDLQRFQPQNLVDVTQEVPQGGSARSVEVGLHPWHLQRQLLPGAQAAQAQSPWASSAPRPSSSWPTERAGRWRDPRQDRLRATRVTDTHQR